MDLGDIDLDHTLSCGQVFRWRKEGDRWIGVVHGHEVRIGQRGKRIDLETDLPNNVLERYFRADDDMEEVYAFISHDDYVRGLVRRFHGLRLIRQDPWECSASYILATYSNIPRIRKMIERICVMYGSEIEGGGHAFPTPAQIVQNEKGAETCGLGFRCERFVEFAKRMAGGGVDFEGLRASSYEICHKRLVSFEGIGDKVADCIAVFSLDHMEAFPIDVRIKRVLESEYGVRGTYGKVSAFARERFGAYAGYAQEYIYYAEDAKNRKEVKG